MTVPTPSCHLTPYCGQITLPPGVFITLPPGVFITLPPGVFITLPPGVFITLPPGVFITLPPGVFIRTIHFGRTGASFIVTLWPYCMAVLHGRIAWPYCMAVLRGRIAWPYCMGVTPAVIFLISWFFCVSFQVYGFGVYRKLGAFLL